MGYKKSPTDLDPSRSVVPNGAELKRLRQSLGMTQEELAESIDYSDRVVRRAESGKRIDLKTLRTILNFFAVNGLASTSTSLGHCQKICPEPHQEPNSLHWTIACWFDRNLHGQDWAAGNILAPEIDFCINGIADVGRYALLTNIARLMDGLQMTENELLHCATTGTYTMVHWRSRLERRGSVQGDRPGPKSLKTIKCRMEREPEICQIHSVSRHWVTFSGMTKFRIHENQIVEMIEYHQFS